MLYREAGQFKSTYAEDQRIFPIRQDRIGFWLLILIAFVIVPLVGNQYWLGAMLTPFLIFALAALGLNILTGYAGQLSLGTAAFMAGGGFTNYSTSGVVTAQQIVIFGYAFDTPAEKYLFTLTIVTVMALAAKNLMRSETGRAFMAVRDMDVAASVIGIPMMKTKLLAFAISSFYCGVAGALHAFCYLGTVEPEAYSLDLSFRILFMVIIGGVGSILGSFLGAAFITLFPIFLNLVSGWISHATGTEISHAVISNLESIIFGGLIIFFLIVEPHGFARLWQIAKEKLRLWPFPH